MDFKAFSEIKKYRSPRLTITQKIHGTNAQVTIWKEHVWHPDTGCEWEEIVSGGSEEIIWHIRAGSRTKWIYPGKDTDNFGFAAFVDANKNEFIEKLGEGTHYGEWAGPGINSGEGLTEKTFVLFNFDRYKDKPLPPQTVLVPVLYDGVTDYFSIDYIINSKMSVLKTSGSRLVPGFMRPEGVVISLNSHLSKKVFDPEDTKWTDPSRVKDPNSKKETVDYTYLCQPIRLEKLLSRDEAYIRDYPKSLALTVKDYVADLEKEDQLPKDPDEAKAIRKNASSQIFKFVKEYVEEHLDHGGSF